MIEIRCFGSFADVAGLRVEIDALNQRSARPDPFSTFAYYEACGQRGDGRGTRLWFLTAFRDRRLVGYLPLRQVEQRWFGMGSRKLEFLITEHNDRPHLVAEPADQIPVSQACWAHLMDRQQEWCWLELAQQEAGSALFPPPATTDLRGHRVAKWPGPDNWTIALRWPTLDAYVQALPKKFRANLRRQIGGLQAAGRLEWLSSSGEDSAAALLELYLSVERQSWKSRSPSRADLSLGSNAARLAQLRRLLGTAQPMRLAVQVLLLDGLPIAGLITGTHLQRLYALHIVHDDRLARYGPGSLILLLGVRAAIAARCTHVDLLAGFGYYKRHWLAESTPTDVGQIYRTGSLADWRRGAGDLLRHWAGVTSSPSPGRERRPDGAGLVGHRWPWDRPPQRPPRAPAPVPQAASEALIWSRNQALLRQARSAAADSLTAAGLAAALPFRTAPGPAPRAVALRRSA